MGFLLDAVGVFPKEALFFHAPELAGADGDMDFHFAFAGEDAEGFEQVIFADAGGVRIERIDDAAGGVGVVPEVGANGIRGIGEMEPPVVFDKKLPVFAKGGAGKAHARVGEGGERGKKGAREADGFEKGAGLAFAWLLGEYELSEPIAMGFEEHGSAAEAAFGARLEKLALGVEAAGQAGVVGVEERGEGSLVAGAGKVRSEARSDEFDGGVAAGSGFEVASVAQGQDDGRIGAGQAGDGFGGGICAGIVDDDDFVVPSRLSQNAENGVFERQGGIVGGNDGGCERRGHVDFSKRVKSFAW